MLTADMTAAQALMERTILTAKKHLKDFEQSVPQAKVGQVTEGESRKAVAARWGFFNQNTIANAIRLRAALNSNASR